MYKHAGSFFAPRRGRRRRRHLDLFAHKILTIAIDLCFKSSSNKQSDDSSRFSERRGNFLQKKVCKRSKSRGCPSVEAFFLAWCCYAVFSCVMVLFFSLFFSPKFDNHQCSWSFLSFLPFFSFLEDGCNRNESEVFSANRWFSLFTIILGVLYVERDVGFCFCCVRIIQTDCFFFLFYYFLLFLVFPSACFFFSLKPSFSESSLQLHGPVLFLLGLIQQEPICGKSFDCQMWMKMCEYARQWHCMLWSMCIGHETATVKEESRNSKNQVV